MATANGPTLFGQAVGRILNSWTALQIAVQHGCGGHDSREKAVWMVTAIETWFSENSNVEDYELEDCLADILNAEFDLILEDGSLEIVAKHICRSYNLIKEGRNSEVMAMLQRLPKPSTEQCRVASDNEEEVDADDAVMEMAGSSGSSGRQTHAAAQNTPTSAGTSGQSSQITNGTGDSAMEVEEEEGWTVVRKGKKR